MKTKTIFLLTFLFAAFSAALNAAEKNDSTKICFINAYDELKNMMEGKQQPNFERAVFVSENAYHNNKYSYKVFQNNIDLHLFFIENLARSNNFSDTMNFVAKVNAKGRFNIDEILNTPKEKLDLYNNAVNNWAIFTYMNDTTGVYPFYHAPFNYSSSDPFGIKEWSNSQVLSLLMSEKQEGNCFALTGFFKILADRLKTGAYICTAPQHIYIQHQDHKGDYYNVELATAGHPADGIIQTLTYTTPTAIKSGISLRSYDDKQSIGLCLINLAKSYEHKFKTKDDDFLLECAETVLQNDSLNLNALLLKHQILNERMLKIISENKTTSLSKLTKEKTFSDLEKQLAMLNRLGYIQMPMDIQEIVLNGFEATEGVAFVDKNPKPFNPASGIPEDENHYMTLTGGLFQEVFEHKKFEEYGQFTFDTETKTIVAIDTAKKNVFLIDPVAFAYDFGARMYDSRTGRWMSIDPMHKKQPGWSPYKAFLDNPILFGDPDGNTEYTTTVFIDEATGQSQTIRVPTSDKIMTDGARHDNTYNSFLDDQFQENYYYNYELVTTVMIDKNGDKHVSAPVTRILYADGVKNRDAVWAGGNEKGDTQRDWGAQTGGYRLTYSQGQGQETRETEFPVETVNIDDLMAVIGAAKRAAGSKNTGNLAEPLNYLWSQFESGQDFADAIEKTKNAITATICDGCGKVKFLGEQYNSGDTSGLGMGEPQYQPNQKFHNPDETK